MKLKIGHKVKFINEDLDGEIKIIISNKRVVVGCSDGFDHEVSVNELIILTEDNEHIYQIDKIELSKKITLRNKEPKQKSLLSKYTSKNKYKFENVLEIDLHLEELVEFPERLDDWQRLHTQMQHVKNCLSAAKNKNIKRIVFIHGVGTGVLKTELHNYLANLEDVEVKKADFREYGAGATEVYLKNS